MLRNIFKKIHILNQSTTAYIHPITHPSVLLDFLQARKRMKTTHSVCR